MISQVTAAPAFPIFATISLLLGQLANKAFVWAYDRGAIESGHYLLLLSGQLGHTNVAHLALNLSALWLLWLGFGHALKTRYWLLTCFISMLSVGLGLYVLNPEVERYLGFSGALHGLFVAGALAEIRRNPTLSIAILIAIAIKLIAEMRGNDMTETAALIEAPVIHFAHLYGALAGVAAWGILAVGSLFQGRAPLS